MDYDVLVVGSGIAGIESALKLGDMGYRVLVVEKDTSVGGKMILLSKVFPTLDCASCISTPKMARTTHHPNITVATSSEVTGIHDEGTGAFRATVHTRPRFVDTAACTGCRQCEQACTVSVPDNYNGELVARRAAHIPFPQAVPLKAVIDRAGTSPCTFACPAGIKAHGYVSLVRSGLTEEAFDLVAAVTPLVATLGRACYAPCEADCTRGTLEGAVPIRRLKRYVADTHDALPNGEPSERPAPTGKRVAIVGSGPAGLTAAWQLARRGHGVTIFEAASAPGGMLRWAIPSYRLPVAAVERDIRRVTDLGVDIVTDTRVDDVTALTDDGFDAVLLAAGTPRAGLLRVPGEDLPGVMTGLGFLGAIKGDEAPDLRGRDVVVVGGGNVAIDAARSARRLGAGSVTMVCLEHRDEMPAHPWEVDEALAEGVKLQPGWGVDRILGETTATGLRLKACTAVFDADGRFAPQYDEASMDELSTDLVVAAVGLAPDTAGFAAQVTLTGRRTIEVDPHTLQTSVPSVFAAGNVVTGPTAIARAVGQGNRAATMIDAWLDGHDLASIPVDVPLGVVDKTEVLARQRTYTDRDPLPPAYTLSDAPSDFAELEPPLTDDEVTAGVLRCLDCGVCSECGECVATCPADAIHLDMAHQETTSPSARSSWRPGTRCSRPTRSPSTASAASPTSSPACRWSGCSPRHARTTPCCGRATGRSPSGSPTSCAPGHGTRRSATPGARPSAACTRSSRTS